MSPSHKDNLQNFDAFTFSKKKNLYFKTIAFFFFSACNRTLLTLTDQQTKTSEGPASSPHAPPL